MVCKSVKAYPRNRAQFIRLKRFCKPVLDSCGSVGITPIAYGSLIYFAYTKDKSMNVNDIDFLVPGSSIRRIAGVLEKRKIRHRLVKGNSLHVFDRDLRIEIDPMDNWSRRLKDFRSFNFGGLTVKSLAPAALSRIYKDGYRESRTKVGEYRRKYNALKALRK